MTAAPTGPDRAMWILDFLLPSSPDISLFVPLRAADLRRLSQATHVQKRLWTAGFQLSVDGVKGSEVPLD